MSAIGLIAAREKSFSPSAYAYRHEHLFFERTQSQALRAMEWEGRVQPLLPWSALIVRGLGITILLSANAGNGGLKLAPLRDVRQA
jgi:hypothetical protein